jgi:hypothetical protein
MSVLEKKAVQDPVVRWAKEQGIVCVRFTPKGDVGWPDHIFVIRETGRVIWIEFKAPGEKPEPIQAYRHDQLRDAKQHVYVVDDKAAGIAILQAHLEPPRVPKESYEDALGAAMRRALPRPWSGED